MEACFEGLPPSPACLANKLITRASPVTGLVDKITYRDLAILLTVDAAPGRKDSGTPQKQTIRSYLRTIETQCGEHFKVISSGQILKIQFTTMPSIYASYFRSQEEYTGNNTVLNVVTPLIDTEESSVSEGKENTDQYTQVYTEEYTPATNACVKIKTLTSNKQINKTNTGCESFSGLRQLISQDFYPSQETIALALSRGHLTVTDDEQIKKFILFNQAISSRWASFDPLYLRWLERDTGSKPIAIKPTKKHNAGSNRHERSIHTNSTGKETMDDMYRHNSNARAPGSTNDCSASRDCIEGQYFVVMDTAERDLRSTVYHQVRCP